MALLARSDLNAPELTPIGDYSAHIQTNAPGGEFNPDRPVDTEWGIEEFGKQAANSLIDMVSYLPDAVGSIMDWIDVDYDENDALSTGADMFRVGGQAMRDWADRAFPADYEPVGFDQALQSWNDGKPSDMLRFMRDSSPQAMVYLLAAFVGGGVPLAISETQRILKERLDRENLTVNDAKVDDVMYSVAGAAVNVFLERLPFMHSVKAGKDFSYLKFLGLENVTEFGQGTFEEIIVSADTALGVDYSEAFKQGWAELLGGVGVVTASAPFAKAGAKKNQALVDTINTAKDEAKATLDAEVAALDAELNTRKTTPADRAKKAELKGKLSDLRKAKTVVDIKKIVPPVADVEVTPEDGGPPAAPEVTLREVSPSEELDAREILGNKKAHSDEEIAEAEQVMRISSALKVEPKKPVSEDVLNIRILGVEESQAVEVTYDLDADQQGTYFHLRDQGAPHEAAMEGAKKGTTKWKGPALSDRYVRPSKEAVTTREDAVARIAEIDAEIDALMAEGVTPEGLGDLVSRPARDEKVRDLKARKVELQKTLRGLPTTTPREAETTPPVTPTRPTEAAPEEGVPARDFATLVDQRIAESEAKIEDLNAQYEAVTGSRFNKKRKRNIINEELESTQRELAGLQRLKARQGEETRTEGILIPGRVRPEERTGVVWEDVAVTEELPPPPAPAVPAGIGGLEVGVAPTAEQIRARQVERDLATQEEAGLREAVEQNRLEAAAREQARAEDEAAAAADAAEAEAAAAAADLEAERLLDEKAQAETARQRIKAKESVITTPGLDPSTLKNEDVTVPGVSDADIRQAQIIKWNNNKRRKNSSRAAEAERIKNEEEVARQEEALNQRREDARKEAENAAKTEAATRKENIDADLVFHYEAKKEEAESARLNKEFEAEETKKTVLWAQNRAADTVDEFSESGYSRSRMVELARSRRRSIETSDRIGGLEAAIAYKEIVERGINEIESARVEKARTTAETTREEGGKEPTPAGLTLNEFQAEYERIRTEQGEDAATQYFKDEAQNVAVEETAGGRPAVAPKTTKKKTTKKKTTKAKTTTDKPDFVVDKEGTARGPEEAAQARVISSPRDAIEAVKAGQMQPDVAIEQLAGAMNVGFSEAEAAFHEEATQADNQAMVKAGEERGAVEAGTTEAVLKEADKTTVTKKVTTAVKRGAKKVGAAVTPTTVRVQPEVTEGKPTPPPEATKRTTTYTGFRKSRSGNYWTAKIANSPARIVEDEVGEFTAVYKGASYPTPFTSFEAAKRHLLETHGTPTERKKIKRPKVLETKVTKEKEKKPARKIKYAEPTVNKAGKTVQIKYEPDVDVNRPYIRHFEGEPISRHETRPSAMHGLSTMDEAKAAEVIRIQEARIARLEGKAVTQAEKDARATGRIDKARAAAEDLGGSVREIRKLDINQQPLPSATHTIIIGRPNVKTDSPGETRFVNEVLEEEDMHPVTVSYEGLELRTKDRTRPERFSESDTSREKFNTFTPFVASTKKDALVLSQSIYANAQKFHRFLQNEVSLQRNPMSLSLGLINDAEAFEFQKAYQGLIRQEKAKETRRKKLTTEQKNSIERWEQRIQDLQTADGRSFKSTIVPGEMGEVTLDSFNDSLQKWIDQLEDTGADTTALREVLANNKKKVDRPLAAPGVDEEEITPRGEVGKDYTQREGENRVYPFEDTYISRIDGAWYEVDSGGDPIDNQPPGIPPIPIGYTRVEAEEKLKEKEVVEADEISDEDLEAAEEVYDEAVAEEVTVDGIEALKSKVADGEKITIAHVGATDLEGMTDDSLRNMDLRDDLGKKLGEGGIGGFPSNKIEEITVSLAEGSNFLEWTGEADIVVLHRIPDEATADALRRTGREADLGAGPTVPEGHTLENWIDAIVDSDASLVYIWGSGRTGDFNGLDFQNVPGYEMVGEWNQEGEMGSGQFALLNKKAEERDLESELTDLGFTIGDPDDLFAAVAAAHAKGTTVLEEQARIRDRQQYTEEQEAIEGAENVIPIDRITDRESFEEALDTFDSNIRDPEDDTFAISMMEQEEEAGTYMSFLQEGIARFPKVTLPDSLFLDDGILRVNRDLVPAGEVVPFEKPVGLMEDVDNDLKQMQKDRDYQLWKEKKDRGKQKTEDKIDPDYILENENPAELYAKLSATLSQGGYSATEVKSLAANIKAANPDFKYNPKGKKADITASIMEWYTKPMDEGYVGTAEEQREYEDTDNDDIVESRRLDSKPDFLSPDRATSTIGKAVNNIFGERIGRRMLSIGFINLINSSTAREMGASSTAQAFVSRKNGAIYFISDRIGSDMDENSIRGLMFHELGVHLGKDVFSGTEWNTVLNEVYSLSKANDPTVNAAVARVMKAYDFKYIDSGPPFAPGKPHVNFQGRREFWEEVLAHVVEIKQPGPIIVNNKLTDKIRNAFRKFFNKIFKAFGGLGETYVYTGTEPSVTIDDLVNLVGYATTQAGVTGLERHGDSKLMSKFRDKKRREFLEGSKVKNLMYHGTKRDWTHPFIEQTELGLHVGTALAAIERVTKRRHSFLEKDQIPYGDVEVRAFEPGWERKISDKNLENIYLDWGESSMETPSPGTSYPMGRRYTTFYDSASVKQGYVNIQNPMPVSSDIGAWDTPYGWNNEALRVLSGDTPAYLGKDGTNKNIKSIIPADEDVWVKISNLARKHMRVSMEELSWVQQSGKTLGEEWGISKSDAFAIGKREPSIEITEPKDFEKKLRELLISEGYDSIEYTNDAEDAGRTSYILLSDNQFKSIDDLAYDSGVSIFSTKKGISATTSSNIQESRRVERESFKEVALSRIGNARASSISNWIQRRVEPLMTIPGYDMLETERMLAKGRIGEWANTGRIIFDILNNANTAERKAIFKYFTTRDADPKMLSNRKVEFAERQTIVRGRTPGDKDVTKTESLRDRVVKTKELIAKMGQDLVDEGFISNEQYSEWKERYLPRVYLEHVLGGTDKAGFGFRMSPLTYTKTRKEHEKFMKDLVSGRIDDPAFLSSRYVSMAGSDMAIKSYLDYIASDPGNNKWVLPGQIMTFKKMKGTADYFKELAREIDFRAGFLEKKDPAKAKQMEALSSEMKEEAETVDSRLRGVDTSKYTKVPDSPRFGAMRGLYVMKDIWSDINGLGIAGNPAWGGLLKWSGRAQKVFKYTKVPMNIPTQIRNIISNTILMNVSGTNFLKIPGVVSQAVYDVSHNGKYMQLARKYGLESTTFASEELVRIDRELATVKARGNSFDGMWARLSVFFDKYLDVGGRAYQKSEVLFKVAKMIDLMENHGKGEAEAAKLANEALLDYSNVSQGIRMLRTMPLGSPFITFNVKAAAQMVRNIKQHPLATAKYAAIPYLFAEMFLSQNDDLDDEDWDALMAFLPDYMETSFSTMVFPTKNEQGKWEAIDISFFLPWGAHLNLAKDVYKQEWGNAIAGTGMFAGPWEIPLSLKLNEDPFTKQPIWNEFDPATQRAQDLFNYLASYMIPPMLMPRGRAGDIVTGGGPLIKTMMAADFIDGNVGRDGLPRYTMPNALLSWFGVSIQQLGRQDVIKKGYYKQKDLDNINKRFLRMINEPAYAGNSAEAIEKRKELREQYREHWLKKYKESMEWAEHLKSLEKLFSEDKKT